MASSNAAWVFGGVRLISSARIMLAKTGPLLKTSWRPSAVSSRISVPVMSEGMRSGVNWMRWKLRSKTSATVFTSSVLARPGAPVIRQWPPASRVMSIWSTTSCWPTMTLPTSLKMRSRAPPSNPATSASVAVSGREAAGSAGKDMTGSYQTAPGVPSYQRRRAGFRRAERVCGIQEKKPRQRTAGALFFVNHSCAPRVTPPASGSRSPTRLLWNQP